MRGKSSVLVLITTLGIADSVPRTEQCMYGPVNKHEETSKRLKQSLIRSPRHIRMISSPRHIRMVSSSRHIRMAFTEPGAFAANPKKT